MYEPAGRSAARAVTVRHSPGAKHERARYGTSAPPADAHEQRVAVAVVAHLLDRERVARRLALPPQLLARAAPEPRLARLARAPLRLLVHPGEHQHAARRRVLHDCRRQLSRIADLDTERAQLLTQRRQPIGILVQDRREQRRLGDLERLGDVLRSARAAGGDHRHANRVRDTRGQRQVVARARAVGVDRGQQDLAGAALLCLARPVGGEPRRRPSCRRASGRAALGIDRDHDRLRAEPLGQLGDELRPRERGRVDRDLVRARGEQLVRVGDRADAAADRERDREPLGDAPHELDQRRASFERRLDVEEHQLVGAASEYAAPSSTGSPTSRSPWKRTPLTTRPAATSRHGIRRGRGIAPPRARRRGTRRRSPLFSGWNWQPTNEPERTSATTPSDQAVAHGVSAAYECAK